MRSSWCGETACNRGKHAVKNTCCSNCCSTVIRHCFSFFFLLFFLALSVFAVGSASVSPADAHLNWDGIVEQSALIVHKQLVSVSSWLTDRHRYYFELQLAEQIPEAKFHITVMTDWMPPSVRCCPRHLSSNSTPQNEQEIKTKIIIIIIKRPRAKQSQKREFVSNWSVSRNPNKNKTNHCFTPIAWQKSWHESRQEWTQL